VKKDGEVIKKNGESLDGWKTVGSKENDVGFNKPIIMSSFEQQSNKEVQSKKVWASSFIILAQDETKGALKLNSL
jgi:hypothetical protein